MRFGPVKQSPIPSGQGIRRDVRTQFAALCYRLRAGSPEILLVTSRTTRRWIVPKGWPMPGMTPVDAAQREAWEEAGVRGKIDPVCLGIYSYNKVMERGDDLPCVVAVFPMRVTRLADDFPEHSQRRRKWFNPTKAARNVAEPELSQILLNFRPENLRGPGT